MKITVTGIDADALDAEEQMEIERTILMMMFYYDCRVDGVKVEFSDDT